ncbi:MAG: hypothetical protein RIT02_1 [Planctomycetota bacterium]
MFAGRIASKGERRRCWSGNQQASHTHKKCSNAIKLRKSDFHRKPCWLYRLHFAGSGSRPNVVRGWKTSFNHESREKKELQRHPKASRTTPISGGRGSRRAAQPTLGRARLPPSRNSPISGGRGSRRAAQPHLGWARLQTSRNNPISGGRGSCRAVSRDQPPPELSCRR